MASLKYISKSIFIMAISFIFTNCATKPSQNTDEEAIAFQKNLKEEYENPDTSPLDAKELEHFSGLEFFPIDNAYRVKAKFTPAQKENIVEFSTSAKQLKKYKEFGILNFKIKGKNLQLTVYQSYPILKDYPDHLFLPFNDLTNGDTSYGGGRYIDLSLNQVQNGEFTLDFNLCYNPYCAYSPNYSCPIPPVNNQLDVEIKAGVAYTPHY